MDTTPMLTPQLRASYEAYKRNGAIVIRFIANNIQSFGSYKWARAQVLQPTVAELLAGAQLLREKKVNVPAAITDHCLRRVLSITSIVYDCALTRRARVIKGRILVAREFKRLEQSFPGIADHNRGHEHYIRVMYDVQEHLLRARWSNVPQRSSSSFALNVSQTYEALIDLPDDELASSLPEDIDTIPEDQSFRPVHEPEHILLKPCQFRKEFEIFTATMDGLHDLSSKVASGNLTFVQAAWVASLVSRTVAKLLMPFHARVGVIVLDIVKQSVQFLLLNFPDLYDDFMSRGHLSCSSLRQLLQSIRTDIDCNRVDDEELSSIIQLLDLALCLMYASKAREMQRNRSKAASSVSISTQVPEIGATRLRYEDFVVTLDMDRPLLDSIDSIAPAQEVVKGAYAFALSGDASAPTDQYDPRLFSFSLGRSIVTDIEDESAPAIFLNGVFTMMTLQSYHMQRGVRRSSSVQDSERVKQLAMEVTEAIAITTVHKQCAVRTVDDMQASFDAIKRFTTIHSDDLYAAAPLTASNPLVAIQIHALTSATELINVNAKVASVLFLYQALREIGQCSNATLDVIVTGLQHVLFEDIVPRKNFRSAFRHFLDCKTTVKKFQEAKKLQLSVIRVPITELKSGFNQRRHIDFKSHPLLATWTQTHSQDHLLHSFTGEKNEAKMRRKWASLVDSSGLHEQEFFMRELCELVGPTLDGSLPLLRTNWLTVIRSCWDVCDNLFIEFDKLTKDTSFDQHLDSLYACNIKSLVYKTDAILRQVDEHHILKSTVVDSGKHDALAAAVRAFQKTDLANPEHMLWRNFW